MPDEKTMLERVAWNIAVKDPSQHGQINDSEMGIYFWEKYRDHYLLLARAGIEAIREPAEAILDAAYKLDDWHGRQNAGADDHWKAMIDEILKEGK